MKRRKFVKQGSALAAGGLLWSCGGSSSTSDSKEMINEPNEKIPTVLKEPGIQLYSLRNELPSDRKGVLKKISEIGYKYLETYLLEDEHHLGFEISEYKKILDDLGLQVMSGHIPTGRVAPEINGTLVNNFEKVIEDAQFLGQKYIVCPYLEDSERTSLDDYKKTIELLNISGEKCKAAGITFCYHNHEFEFIEMDGTVPMEMIIEGTEADKVQIELDIYWTTVAGRDAKALFDKYPGRFVLWHVKDKSKIAEETTFVGDGSINYAEIFKNSENSGLEYYFVEQEHYPTPVFEGIKQSFDYLQRVKI